MKIVKGCLVAMLGALVLVIALVAVSGGGSGSDVRRDAEQDAGPIARVSGGDFNVVSVSVDGGGVGLVLRSERGNVSIYPQLFEVDSTVYSMFAGDGSINPSVHIAYGGYNNAGMVDLMEGEDTSMRISIDGVSNYDGFKMRFDETLWSDDSPRAYQVLDCSLTVTSR